jgi:hypothetical protein
MAVNVPATAIVTMSSMSVNPRAVAGVSVVID